MTNLYLVRHGPTHAKAMVGWTDLPADLSNTEQIARLKASLPPDALVISSDLSRAVTTADAVQGSRQRLDHDADLREIHFGDWEMAHFSKIEDQDHLRAYWEEPGDIRPPNGESWHDVCARVSRAVDRLIEAHTGANIVIVAHFGAILTQIQRAERLDNYQAFRHRLDNLSVTEVSLANGVWATGVINHCP